MGVLASVPWRLSLRDKDIKETHKFRFIVVLMLCCFLLLFLWLIAHKYLCLFSILLYLTAILVFPNKENAFVSSTNLVIGFPVIIIIVEKKK